MKRAGLTAVLLVAFLMLAAIPALAATLTGTLGVDNISGTATSDRIDARAGNDTVHGLGSADKIFGQHGNDTLTGEDGGDAIYGAYGDDRIDGGPGRDVLVGADGDDVINAGGKDGERDTYSCGPGFDTVIIDGKDHSNEASRDECEIEKNAR